jgi:hypothetical protein
MSQPDLSLYVPVFNAAPWLAPLFATMRGLDERRVEIVFVDDCSTDESGKMLEGFAAGRANTVVIRQPKNGGEGVASNTGLARCSGKYILRCDSDDEVCADGVMEALEMALSGGSGAGGLDAVFQPYVMRIEGEPDKVMERKLPEGAAEVLDGLWRGFYPALWATLIRRELAQRAGMVFRPIAVGTDLVWAMECFEGVETARCGFSKQPGYVYVRRPGSAMAPRSDQLPRHAERLLLLLAAKQVLGADQVKRGLVKEDAVAAGCRRTGHELLRALRKSGQYGRALSEYHRIRASFGSNQRLRREFWRVLPVGMWRMLWP